MKIILKLILLGYQNQEFQSELIQEQKNWQLPQIQINQPNTNLVQQVQNFCQHTLELSLQPTQINLQPPLKQVESDTLIVPVLILITPNQLTNLRIYNQKHDNFKLFMYTKLPIHTNHQDKKVLQSIPKILQKAVAYQSLKAIQPLLPQKFTAKFISILLTTIENHTIPRNNVKRDFGSELKQIGVDRSKRGRPVNLFTYHEIKLRGNYHEVPIKTARKATIQPSMGHSPTN